MMAMKKRKRIKKKYGQKRIISMNKKDNKNNKIRLTINIFQENDTLLQDIAKEKRITKSFLIRKIIND